MPTTQNVTTDYVGTVAQGYITRAVKSGDTLGQGLVNVKTGLKEAGMTIRRLDVSNLIKDSTCTFDDSGQIDLDFRKLTGKKLEVNVQICLDELEGAWEAEDMGDSANDNVPQPYINELLTLMASKIGEANDSNIWNGDGANAGEMDGFFKIADDSGLVPAPQNITGVPITAANVATEIGKVADAIPDAVFNLDSDLVIVCSSDVARKYMRALAGFGASGQGGAGYKDMGFVGRKPLDFEGIPMYVVGGLPAGTMAAYKIENMVFGTGVLKDWTNVRVIDMRIVGDDTFRFIAKMYAGCQIGFPDEIVLYRQA